MLIRITNRNVVDNRINITYVTTRSRNTNSQFFSSKQQTCVEYLVTALINVSYNLPLEPKTASQNATDYQGAVKHRKTMRKECPFFDNELI